MKSEELRVEIELLLPPQILEALHRSTEYGRSSESETVRPIKIAEVERLRQSD